MARMSTPGSNAGLARALIPPIAGSHADDAVVLVEHFDRGKAGEHVDAFGLDQTAQPLHEAVQRDDVVAVVDERRRRDGKRNLRATSEEVHVVVMHLGRERRLPLFEVGHEQPQRRGVEDGPDSMWAGLACLLENGTASGSPPWPS